MKLRIRGLTRQQSSATRPFEERWTLEKIKEGFARFYAAHGRLPTAPEVDKIEYLPSSGQIQRKFGGLISLRQLLGYKDINFGKGLFRIEISNKANLSGLKSERLVEKFLVNKFGEPFVHVEKRFGDGKTRFDFYVYSPTGNFAVDVISSGSFRDLQKNVNTKIPKYATFRGILYFVVVGEFEQNQINKWILNKRVLLPEDCEVLTFNNFQKEVLTFQTYVIGN